MVTDSVGRALAVLCSCAALLALAWPGDAAAATPTPGIWKLDGSGTTSAFFTVRANGTIDRFFGAFSKPDPGDPITIDGQCGAPRGIFDGIPIASDGTFEITVPPSPPDPVPVFELKGRFVTATEAAGTFLFAFDCGRDGPDGIVQQFTAHLTDADSPAPPPAEPTPTAALAPLKVPVSGHIKLCATVASVAMFSDSRGRRSRQSCTPTAALSGRRDSALPAPAPQPPAPACLGVQRFERRGAWCRNVSIKLIAVVSGPEAVRIPLGTVTMTERIDEADVPVNVRVRRWALQHAWVPDIAVPSLTTRITMRCRRSDKRACATAKRSVAAPVRGAAQQFTAPLILTRAPAGRHPTGTVRTRLGFRVGSLPMLEPLGGELISAPFRGSASTWVFPAFTPTVSFSRARMPAIGALITAAQAAGLPGAPGARSLHRIAADDTPRNRSQTACGRAPRAFTLGAFSCAEYPFTSTREGGVKARISKVPRTEQQAHLAALSAFYRSQQVLPGDRFRVAAAP